MTEAAHVCLVSMPFMPIQTPALGPSLLKAGLEREGIGCDIFYGSLELLRLMAEEASPADAEMDYEFLASAADLGDVLFAPTLWLGQQLPARSVLEAYPCLPGTPFAQQTAYLIAARLGRLLYRVPTFIGRCLNARDWGQYNIIGFSSVFSQHVGSLVLARAIKAAWPDITVVFGGANCEGDMGLELIRSFPFVDHVLRGEADLTFPTYVRRVLAGASPSPLPGLLSRQDGAIASDGAPSPVDDMDALPDPAFADYFAQRPGFLSKDDLTLVIETSRGCWWGAVQHCVFCGLNPTGMAFRSKSPPRVLAMIRALTTRWGVRNLVASDNILDMRYFKDVLPQLRGLDLTLFYETKSNLKEHHVRTLADAGARVIQPGIESLNTATLALMKKGAKAFQQIEMLKWCATYAVRPVWFYLYALPGEQAAWYHDDIALFERLHHLPPPQSPNPIIVDRYSPLFRQAGEHGLSNLRPAWHADLCYAGLSAEARARMSYHFDAVRDVDAVPYYVAGLYRAIDRWRSRHAAGARLEQRSGDSATLIVDHRRAPAVAWLLMGAAHRLYALMRTAQTPGRLRQAAEAPTAEDTLSATDLYLTMAAMREGAEAISMPEDGSHLDDLLAQLDRQCLVVHLDGLWLALATDAQAALPEPAPAPAVAAAALEPVF